MYTRAVSTLPLAEARNRLSELLESVDRTHERVTITRHGHPIAVVLAPDDLDALEESLAILATPGAVEAIREGQAQIAGGGGGDWEGLATRYRQEQSPRP